MLCIVVLQHLKTPEISVLGNTTWAACVGQIFTKCFTMMYEKDIQYNELQVRVHLWIISHQSI